MTEWTDVRLQRLDIYRGDEQLRSDIRAALDTISAQFRRAETAEAERLRAGCSCEARADVERLRAALQQISEGEGRYSRDPLEHASNTIEDMQALAIAALHGEGEK